MHIGKMKYGNKAGRYGVICEPLSPKHPPPLRPLDHVIIFSLGIFCDKVKTSDK